MLIRNKSSFLAPLLVMFLVAIATQVGLFLFPFVVFASWEERGQFGDSFGFINAVFTGFALYGVIFSLTVQIREQSRQRRDTRSVLDGQIAANNRIADALESQAKELHAIRIIMTEFERPYGK